MKRKILGVPVFGIIAIVTVLAIGGGAALGAFLFNRSQEMQFRVMGGAVELYEDSGCTIPLDAGTQLQGGDIRFDDGGGTPVTIYAKNEGTDSLLPVMSIDDLPAGVSLVCNAEAVGGSGDPLVLWSAEVINSIGVLTGVTGQTTLAAAIDDVQTNIPLATGAPGTPEALIGTYLDFPTGEVCEIVDLIDGGVTVIVIRGSGAYQSTVASGAVVRFGASMTPADITPADYLDPSEVLSLTLSLAADETAVANEDTQSAHIDIAVTSSY